MNEPITFWLENRHCSGTIAAVIGVQQLVHYRDRYYVVEGGAAQTRAGKPLRFSNSSLPASWKLALKGEVPVPAVSFTETEPAPLPQKPKRERKKTEASDMEKQQEETVPELKVTAPLPGAKPKRKSEAKPAAHPPVVANCPYCHVRHDIPLEKGKSGKPFFMNCSKCSKEFAVRFVQVTMYQAQVAGFQ
ncbi:hypothetical protein OR1_02701 [Geobacter sp. OR-1]|uniref:hypothetical protein n=1 Tax=Geobacter sp. OR-1 TaxID=1266765 RepID=UPI000541C628|nr:hypothetical protein [Geobacter sp. OR-1]GAM10412.1 hypothetical protein OR1_02701 [Geobacter sp. OR-1]